MSLDPVTQTTITDADALVAQILEGRKRGYFVTRGENVADVWAVSGFVMVSEETFGIAIAGPAHRLEGNLDACAALVASACTKLARP